NVHRARLDSVFEFKGYVEDTAPLYAACEVVILPSRAEGIPLVALEALACSRPVIASNVGAISELIDPTCGVLIEVGPKEAFDFAVGVPSLLNQDELRAAMGAAGRRKVRAEYDHRRARNAYLDLFCQLTGKSNEKSEGIGAP